MIRTWYRLHDTDPRGCWPIEPCTARCWNVRGYGIFASVNQFDGPRRKENLVRVNSWYVEVDKRSKLDQWKLVRKYITPSLIVESRRGYHVYFDAKDGTAGNWNAIVRDRLVHYYQADESVHDLTRVLRVPGFYHRKDPLHPFLVQEVFRSDYTYREADLLSYFPLPEQVAEKRAREKVSPRVPPRYQGNDFWQRVYTLDCELALNRLSGSRAVNCEVYDFKPVSGGKLNIVVNGEPTASWIDREKRIGSRRGGGPSIVNWLKYYGHDWKRIQRILVELFPELRDKCLCGEINARHCPAHQEKVS